MHNESELAKLGPRFTVFQARQAGVDPSRLRGSDLEAPFTGVRTVPLADGARELSRHGRKLGAIESRHLHAARAFATAMSTDEFFSHVTAAVIWGIPLPRMVTDSLVHVGVFAPARPPKGRGIRGHEARRHLTRVVTDPHTGLRVTDPASTWAMLAAILRHPYDVVAAADAVLRTWRVDEPLATLDELEESVSAGRRVGIGRLREALPRARARVASRTETWTRLTLIDAGLPEPELAYDVHEAGIRIACVDLAYPELKIAIEYEGEHHLRDPDQWNHDIARYEALEAAGWHVIRVTKAELFDAPGRLAARVRRAIARRR
jgi:hypothetical protein